MSSINHAYNHLQQGELEQARTILLHLTNEHPEDSQTLYLLGLVALQQEDENEAISWFEKTIALAPEATPAHFNLGILHYNQGNFAEACSAYESAADLAKDDTDIRFNLALTYKKLGQPHKAKIQFEHILGLSPNDPDTLYNLANTEQQMGRSSQAISHLETLLQQQPNHLSALNNLGYLYHKEGEGDKAIPIYRALIENNHNSKAAEHLLASLTGTTTSQAPASYVKEVFDQFADHFDKSLQDKLGYNTPTLLRDLLMEVQPEAHFKHGLDLGCGTGLSGQTFHDISTSLTGIDLSPKMLDQARDKQLYSELHETDLVPFIEKGQTPYDLYIAADVFVYIGDLNPIFNAIAHKPGEHIFIFSTEQATEDYTLKPTGRYGHSQGYIKKLAKAYGFSIITHQSAPLRKEGHDWINGELYILAPFSDQ